MFHDSSESERKVKLFNDLFLFFKKLIDGMSDQKTDEKISLLWNLFYFWRLDRKRVDLEKGWKNEAFSELLTF